MTGPLLPLLVKTALRSAASSGAAAKAIGFGSMSFSEKFANSFMRTLQGGVLKGLDGANIGSRVAASVEGGLKDAFKEIPRRRSAEMWGRATGARKPP